MAPPPLLGRRALLRLLLAGAAAPSLACAAPPSRPAKGSGKEADVLVLGAGVAGLRAAEVLKAAGKAVIVLEARDRVGGRIHTDRSWGAPMELGASWIHGVAGNPVKARLEAAGIPLVTAGTEQALYGPDGTRLAAATVERTEQRVAQLCEEGRAGSPETDEPLRAAFDRAVAARGARTAAQQLEDEQGLTSTVEHEYAADAAELSALHFDAGANEAGGDAFVPGGYDQLVALLAEGLDIRTAHVVSRVDTLAGGLSVTTDKGTFRAKAVVVTVPLGVLKAGRIAFGTPLSARKRLAVARLGMGALSKTLLRFPAAAWPTDVTFLDRVPPAHERGQWVEGLQLSTLSGVPALMLFNAGAFARAQESLTEEAAVSSALKAWRTALQLPAPAAVLRSQWTNDPSSLGAYSFLGVGATLADRDALAAREGAVFFAGEACAPEHAATVHGAYQSGERAARECLSG
jgi:polyamine oxidase